LTFFFALGGEKIMPVQVCNKLGFGDFLFCPSNQMFVPSNALQNTVKSNKCYRSAFAILNCLIIVNCKRNELIHFFFPLLTFPVED